LDRERITEEARKIQTQAAKGGYKLHPDLDFVEQLVEGILTNRDRYGYDSCPCRLATGDAKTDLAIVCPCVYRDPDLADYDACFCALYVAEEFEGDDGPVVPDRWDPDEEHKPAVAGEAIEPGKFLPAKAHVCQVCGYVSMMESAPRKCPVCGATHERFTPIQIAVSGI
jgi:ferredoxin-thioredoxin reductase catalytic subunit